MRSASFFLLLMALAGCLDRGPTLTSPSPPALHMNAPGDDGDVRFGEAAFRAWQSLPEAEALAGRAIMRRLDPNGAAELPRRLAIVERALPDASVAWVIRDPELPGSRLIVVPRESLRRELVMDVVSVLMADERRVTAEAGRRLLRVGADGRVVTSTGALVRGRNPLPPSADPPPDLVLRQLRAVAAREEQVDLPGLGPALMLTFE